MVREDIVTALRNAVNSGESLQYAMQVMINSGYNSNEVQEASHFVGGGIIQMMQPKPEEELTMPKQKGILGKLKKPNLSAIPQPGESPLSQPRPEERMPSPFTNDKQAQSQPQTPEEMRKRKLTDQQIEEDIEEKVEQIAKENSYFVEILLFVILLALIGALVGTVIYKDTLINYLSKLVN